MRLRGVPVEAQRTEAFLPLRDEPGVASSEAERPESERLEVRAAL